MPRQFLYALLVSLGLSLTISVIPNVVVKKDLSADIPTFQEMPKQVVYTHNIVDLLAYMQTYHKVSRVEWKQPSLRITLHVKNNSTNNRERMFKDTYAILYHCLLYTENIEKITVRFSSMLNENQGAPELEIEANRISAQELDKWEKPEQVENAEDYVKKLGIIQIREASGL
ncbi:hypothetical protein [Brevibacillus daliensis]|uniref:hypothetical protein n=1 Tax=Brevibacillus daliensis TaxID=2892995 RepID=UPI001E532D04|nr:hypothetical protein [Brevibacillus daliensis]